MIVTKPQLGITQTENTSKLELYRLIGEGYKAMKEGRVSDIDEVKTRLESRRQKNN